MKLSDLLNDSKIEYTLKGNSGIDVADITFDSRKAAKGTMFFCLVGSASDGHEYALSAYENGCRVFAVSRDVSLPEDATVVYFENTRKALAFVSAAFFGHPCAEMKIIGITGTKGKTSIANMISSCLRGAGIPCGCIGTCGIEYADVHFETKNTTPESLELHRAFRKMLDAGTKVCVIEVSSQALFNHRVDGIDFFIGVYTNLSPDHIGPSEHPDFEHYKTCKKRLFSLCRHGIFNLDDEYFADMTAGCKCSITSYGLNTKADFTAENIHQFNIQSKLGTVFDAVFQGRKYSAKIPFPGEFSVLNTLAVLAVCETLSVPADKSVSALENTYIAGRFETVSLFDDRIFVIDYAHNEVSMRTLLETVKGYNPKRIITVFGSVGDRTKNRRAGLGSALPVLPGWM